MDFLFKDITAVTMCDTLGVLKDTCVGVTGTKISYIGPFSEDLRPKRVIDGRLKTLMPGLYNCHSHSPMSLLRGYSNDVDLQDWLFNHIFPAEAKYTPEMIYIGAMVSIAEMISSGTVSFTDMYFGLPQIAKAALETGIKANLTNAFVVLDESKFDFKSDRSYIETFDVLNNFSKASDGRIKADAGIHAEYTSAPKFWAHAVDFAHENGLNMHIHLSETLFEHEQCKKNHGKTPTQMFYDHGVFDVNTTAAHSVWVEPKDVDLLAEKGVTVAHNPISNLKLGSGIAPIAEMIRKGVNVAIGTDGVASNNTNDIFEELKIACLLQKTVSKDPKVMPAYETLRLATINGAKAQGRDKDGGQIKVGYDADLVVLDLDSPRQTACYDPLANIIYSTTGRDVFMTLVNGKVLYENGEYKTLDVEKILFEARNLIKIF